MLTAPKNAHLSPSSILLRGPYYFDPLKPDPKAITLDAVAASLDAEVRFLSQTTRRIPVSEHLIRCARIAFAYDGTLAQILACMMHDCGEAPMRDLPGPFKRYVYVQLPDGDYVPYSVVEARVCAAIVEALIPDETLRDEVLAELEHDDGFVHRVDKDAEAIEALKWLPGSEDWEMRNIDPRAWMVADVPDGCEWSAYFDEVAWMPSCPWTENRRVYAYGALRRSVGL